MREQIVKYWDKTIDFAGSAGVATFIFSLKTLFIFLGLLFLFFTFYFLIRAGFFANHITSYKWYLKDKEKEPPPEEE